MRYQDKKKASGFTLIEIMVAISIFSLFITYLVNQDNSTFQHRMKIQGDIVSIQSLLSNARSMAINSTAVEAGGTTTVVPQNGYGVYMNLQPVAQEGITVVLFADTDDDGVYTSGSDTIIGEEYAFFDSGQYVRTEVFGELDGVDENNTDLVVHPSIGQSGSSIDEFTVLFAPLTAHSTILLDNAVNLNTYTDFILYISMPGVVQESIEFNTISRFFTREFVSADPTPTP